MNPGYNCKDCFFWTGDRRDEKGQGDCRRFPPVPAGLVPMRNVIDPKQSSVSIISGFPSVHATSWCGEFKMGDQLKN